MTPTPYADEKYYQAVSPHSLSERLMVITRDRIYADFLRYCGLELDDTVLDVGVSDVVNDAANMLKRKYPHPERGYRVGFSKSFPRRR